MKSPFLLILSAAAVMGLAPVHGAATVYQTLQYYAQQRGEPSLKDVMLIRGEGGEPHPEGWMIFKGQPNASSFQTVSIGAAGGLRGGRASAAETGLQPHAEPINFSMLNVDSNAAFRIATREAKRENFAFDRVDYTLKTNSLAGVPAWTMTLFNQSKGYLATLTISATTGVVLRPIKIHSYLVEGSRVVKTPESFYRRAVRSIGRWFSQTGTTFGRDIVKSTKTSEEIYIGNPRKNDVPDDD